MQKAFNVRIEHFLNYSEPFKSLENLNLGCLLTGTSWNRCNCCGFQPTGWFFASISLVAIELSEYWPGLSTFSSILNIWMVFFDENLDSLQTGFFTIQLDTLQKVFNFQKFWLIPGNVKIASKFSNFIKVHQIASKPFSHFPFLFPSLLYGFCPRTNSIMKQARLNLSRKLRSSKTGKNSCIIHLPSLWEKIHMLTLCMFLS